MRLLVHRHLLGGTHLVSLKRQMHGYCYVAIVAGSRGPHDPDVSALEVMLVQKHQQQCRLTKPECVSAGCAVRCHRVHHRVWRHCRARSRGGICHLLLLHGCLGVPRHRPLCLVLRRLGLHVQVRVSPHLPFRCGTTAGVRRVCLGVWAIVRCLLSPLRACPNMAVQGGNPKTTCTEMPMHVSP